MKKHRASSSTSGLACFVICLFLFIIQMSFSPVPILHVTTTNTSRPVTETTVDAHQELLRVETKTTNEPESPRPPEPPLTTSPINCDRSDERYDLCKINGPTILDPTTSTFYVAGPTNPPVVEKIKPYPRKYEDVVMVKINDVTLKTSGLSPPCQVHHAQPGLVYSAGGYTGNFFHDFNDGFIPLFITINTIFPDQDIVIVVTQSPNWWAQHYEGLLQTFSKHPIVTLKNDTRTHCFPNASLGLLSHGFMTINQTLLPNSRTMLHFRGHLDEAYGKRHPFISASEGHHRGYRRPRVVLVSLGRGIGRRILNEPKLIKLMEKIGFEVVLFNPKPTDLFQDSYALINSSHAMVGVHGAALTHSLFLRPGSMFLQVVPIGVNWAADTFFGRVGRGMGFEYMEYKIEVEESSLVKKYGRNSELVNSPYTLQSKGWPTSLMDIYLKEQEINLNLKRFRGYLEKAYENAKRFMDKEG